MDDYGKYAKLPTALEQLRNFDAALKKEGLSLDAGISFMWTDNEMAYTVTPYDVIVFGHIGSDGIHYGLLSDFGTVPDLENAFVVCLSPTDYGDHIKLVAKNAAEFVDLLYTMKSAVAVSNFLLMSEQAHYQKFLKYSKESEGEYPEYEAVTNRVIEKMKDSLGCQTIEDVYQYVEVEVKEERAKQTVLATHDGLGVVPINNTTGQQERFQVEKDVAVDLEQAEAFFARAPIESRLAFIRDAQFFYHTEDDPGLKRMILKEMRKLNLMEESDRLERG
ncbi:hypothetical protein [Planomicrobium sp. CPCC 101110]|uniref:hypothetical protein n=1 Tax=Planomicrobium sp. CPCC 101110 TaxID=2599619 RepID=UPI0011B6A775|nr:hypothetical protein [Planomicrobium sp. CPCC 101110]TWT25389.1 hypothetical protein FQV30_13610 [Planomicrobium sp. CPCC 101110]